jgi:hypothetical protein
MKTLFSKTLLNSVLSLTALVGLASTASAHEIMGWVPPYNLENSKKIIAHKAGGIKTSDWLTRFGLQFWGPTKTGGVEFVTHESELDDELVALFVSWGKANKIPVYLTIYNNNKVWDWELARSAFKDNRTKFVTNLIATMEKYQLDGIDLDLEGNGDFDGDREAYKTFVIELSAAVKAKGKKLTVDSFHSPCANAPHMGWFKDWVGYVDAIHSMGYQDLYEGSTETFKMGDKVCENGAHIFKYSWQTQYAAKSGFPAPKILMGVPAWMNEWGSGAKGSSIQNHLDEVAELKTGIAIWDLPGMMDNNWKSPETFKALKAFKEKK